MLSRPAGARALVLALALACLCSCLDASSVSCANGETCPAGTLCDDVHELCVTRAQYDACEGLADGEGCDTPAAGTCHAGVCLASACGNGRTDVSEVCDDGNVVDRDADGLLDACAADCKSTNRCGNGRIDLVNGETCDDGDFLDHDGCSSTCQDEAPGWLSRPVSPGSRYMVGAFDAARGRLVVVGGGGSSTTWEWDQEWREVQTNATPPPAYHGAAVYDAARERVVVFGGELGVIGNAQTWEWDGVAWSRGSDAPRRTWPAAAYDPKRERIVVFGGQTYTPDTGIVTHAETFVRVNGTWSTLTVSGTPPARTGAAMAYDPVRDRIVLYGGASLPDLSGTILDDLWELDGTTWRQIAPPVSRPPGLARASMAFDPVRRAVVLFGGFTDQPLTPSDALWSWNGTTWTELPTTTKPPARGGGVLASDGTHLVLIGGATASDGSGLLDDTWLYEAGSWRMPVVPERRGNYGLVADRVRGRLVMFGGLLTGANTYLPTDELWELSAAGWERRTGTMPPGGQNLALIFDPDRNVTLLVVAPSGDPSPPLETWTWNGTQWTKHTPASTPPLRRQFSLAHDAASKGILLFGGNDGSVLFGDTWRWNGQTWTQVATSGPPARLLAAMAGDPLTGRVLLHSGSAGTTTFEDTWEWDGSTWTQLQPLLNPTPSNERTLLWNPGRRRLTLISSVLDIWEWDATDRTWVQHFTSTSPDPGPLYGSRLVASRTGDGLTQGIAFFSDTAWELRWDASGGAEDCRGSDLDNDGLTRCDDPDCWVVCTPACPPSTSCAAGSPRCGDGICQDIESCATCPGDCTCTDACGDFVCNAGESTSCPGDCP